MIEVTGIRIHPADTVAVTLSSLAPGDRLQAGGVHTIARESVPCGHKIALVDIAAGANVIKYGAPIGHATRPISAGDWVHLHNLATNLDQEQNYRYRPAALASLDTPSHATFLGYPRANGMVGTRNELWIIPTNSCVNAVAETLAGSAGIPAGENLDGVVAFPHPYGCSQLGQDHQATQRVLASLAGHPNAAGVLVIGLGCENNHIAAFREALGPYDAARILFLNCQEVADEQAEGRRLLAELAQQARACTRRSADLGRLCLGFKCGGSDAFSGITANPLAGRVADRIVAAGGSALLTEVPEMFGAETLLLDRSVSREVFDDTAGMLNRMKAYYRRHGQVIYENPSPGNKEGGITTLEEKSLGCTQKAGHGAVVDALGYGDRVRKPGVTLIEGPGNDPVAVTALAAAGTQVILFTTGRGTPLGSPVPTLKISSNSRLAARKPHWIDFDAGRLLEGKTMEELAEELFSRVLEVASGAPTRQERSGQRGIAIWKDGVTL
jgi:altronate hydrolase